MKISPDLKANKEGDLVLDRKISFFLLSLNQMLSMFCFCLKKNTFILSVVEPILVLLLGLGMGSISPR